ncbi:MAG: hypothetical protein JSU79_05055 [Dehalococcoidales bacterium]|nr:MAG: hypothetical protein JSU79_05055 [Dehalococcoidales bacterium]
MVTSLSRYLDDIRSNLRLDAADANEVIDELQSHIEDEFQDMRDAGLSEEEAAESCIKFFGSAAIIARQIYETHSQGTWKQALLASLPHMLFALLFILNWWQGVGVLIITLGVVLAMALYGWLHGRPVWLFPWRGYYFIPVLVAGILLLYLPAGWSWVAIIIYLPLVAVLIWSVTVKTVKRDWLYSALMTLPVPIVIGWFLAAGKEGEFLKVNLEYIGYFAPGIGLSFLALAATTIAFIRLRQRWLRGVLLILSSFLTLNMVMFYSEGRISLPLFLGLTLIMLIVLLSPAVVDHRIRRNRQTSK